MGIQEQLADDFDTRLKESRKGREAEWEAVKKEFPIDPNSTPEEQQQMWIKQQAAMLDP